MIVLCIASTIQVSRNQFSLKAILAMKRIEEVPDVYESFQKFTDAQWRVIVKEVRVSHSLELLREHVERWLSLYSVAQCDPGVGFTSVSEHTKNMESSRGLKWYRYDLVAGHLRLATALRATIESFD